jgi:hypothetical protein
MIQRVLSTLLATTFLIAVFLFTSLLVALAATAAIVLWAWTWWRSRARRGRVLEGEYRIIETR